MPIEISLIASWTDVIATRRTPGERGREDQLLGRFAALVGDPEATVGEPAVEVVAQVGVGGGHRVGGQAEQLADPAVFIPVALAVAGSSEPKMRSW
jgi:hypothetical protein